MKSLVVIPARYNSTRFPGKPLIDMKGKTMIQRVYEQCKKSSASTVIVTTDSKEIYEHVQDFGGKVYMSGECETGTERVINTVLELPDQYDIIVNVQGDEPFISPEDIDSVIVGVRTSPQHIMTLVTRLSDNDKKDRNVVKCLSKTNLPYLFTRSPIYSSVKLLGVYKHIGIYGFSNKVLETINKFKVKTINEQLENLEQLRWMDEGLRIKIAYTENQSIGIDTESDLIEALKLL